MHVRRGPAAIVAAALLTALAACGEDDEQPSTVTVTEAAEDATTSRRSRPVEPEPPSPAEAARAVVKRYYEAVNGARYDEAWRLLAPSLQTELGGFSSWRQGYSSTIKTQLEGADVTDISGEGATVAIEISATDLDACGDTVKQTFAGTWSLTPAGKSWQGAAFDVAKTGGGTPVSDPASCGGSASEAPVPLSGSGCDPNYTGCVPPYPPDVDCIDVGREVDVIGDDVHHLDLGGDGEACEVFFR